MSRTAAAGLLAIVAVCGTGAVAQMSFGSAVDLALRNSSAVQAAQADQAHAKAALEEVKDAYIPSLTFGSGLAYTNGFPIGDPSVVRLVAQSLIFNFSQRDNIRAAREANVSSALNVEEQRQQVVLDTALTYSELAATEETIAALKAQGEEASRLVDSTQQRLQAGLDAPVALKRAQLREAQTRLKRLNLQARSAELRQHLGDLTGIPLSGVPLDAASIPAFPAVPAAEDTGLPERAVDVSLAVKEADAQTKIKSFEAFAQHRVLYRPEFDLVSQYGYFSDINNYSTYYYKFTNSNVALGVQIQLPLFNAVQRARARQADADTAKATAQARTVRDQVRENTVSAARAATQTAAAEEVALLQHDIADDDAKTVALQANAGSAPDAQPVTPQQVMESRLAERQLYADYLAARFEHVKAELNLLKMTGELESWARTALAPGNTPTH